MSPDPTFPKTVVLAAPRGFCAGVVRAIDIVDLALEAAGAPLYVRKEIVHNRHVVESFEKRGVRFVDELTEVPDGQTVIFSAHGVSPAVRTEAAARGLTVLDATCPLVTKVHLEAIRYARAGFEIILIGHPSHEEVEGTLGEAADRMTLVSTVAEAEAVPVKNPDRLAFLTQTTLSVEDTRPIVAALQRRFPGIRGPARADICYATQNRQLAVRAIAREAPVILVVGSKNSSNSNRLVEEAELAGARAYLVDDVSEMDPAWLEGASAVGVTSGASAPDFLIEAILETLRKLGATEVREVRVVDEDVFFPLPPELAALRKARERALAPSV
ncbi:MAG: 4-hydroxy-3-methylbut-2-enyl diphosphate reductase [Acidobacteria bacterium]|nr:4-hydroxy-3-methylbut-2-enyl diphosphate reductase [Acidobacteriota bacterium]MCA1611232.1 4-hydroxy-3-methylbut-2-enyl diphosphate reductase [Acidobacteriota bacterium]